MSDYWRWLGFVFQSCNFKGNEPFCVCCISAGFRLFYLVSLCILRPVLFLNSSFFVYLHYKNPLPISNLNYITIIFLNYFTCAVNMRRLPCHSTCSAKYFFLPWLGMEFSLALILTIMTFNQKRVSIHKTSPLYFFLARPLMSL